MKKFFLIISLVVILSPLLALAQDTPSLGKTGFERVCLRPDPNDPSKNQLALGQCVVNLYRLSLGLGALVAMFMTILAGYRYMNAAGSAEQVEKAKESFAAAITGLIILFVAYALLYTINPDLVKFRAIGDIGKLPEIQFEQEYGPPVGVIPGRACADLEALSPLPKRPGVPGTQISGGLKTGLVAVLNDPFSQAEPWWITEAYPPSQQHKDPGHTYGYAVDLAFSNKADATPQNINSLYRLLRAQEFWVLDEYTHPSQNSTGGHFHVRGSECNLGPAT